MKLVYPAVFSPCTEGGYTITFPDLPGCFTEGDDLAEAMFMAQDAASGWILGEMEDGEEIPESSCIEDIHTEDEQFVNLIVLDMDSYAEKYGKKAVKKTLTIPAWMNTYVEKHGVSCSKLLQEAISKVAML